MRLQWTDPYGVAHTLTDTGDQEVVSGCTVELIGLQGCGLPPIC
jgi:hypothetical protein